MALSVHRCLYAIKEMRLLVLVVSLLLYSFTDLMFTGIPD